MKKIFALAVGMLLIPFTAFGMEAMSDGDMDSITGQSGVAISLENIQIYQHNEGTELWYQGGSDGAVGLVYGEDSYSYLFIDKINPTELDVQRGTYDPDNKLTLNDTALFDGDGVNMSNDEMRQLPSVLSISVQEHDDDGVFGEAGTNYLSSAINSEADSAYIQIGLPTLEIVSAAGNRDELSIYVSVEDDDADSSNPLDWDENANASLGTIYTSDGESTTAIMGGRLGITALGAVHTEIVDYSMN